MRPETEQAILAKVDIYPSYRGSAQHAVDDLTHIGVKNPTSDVLLSFLYSGFSDISYVATAVIEGRIAPRTEILDLWSRFCKDPTCKAKVDSWIDRAVRYWKSLRTGQPT